MIEEQCHRAIHYFDEEGRRGSIRYDELLVPMGEDRQLTLYECLQEEEQHVQEFRKNASYLASLLRRLEPFYDEIEADPVGFAKLCRGRLAGLERLTPERRLRVLNSYYGLNDTHNTILNRLTEYLLSGAEGELSAFNISLLRRAVDYTCRVMRHKTRKTTHPAAVHAIEAARGAAKNGLRITTIMATLMHDVVEERLDMWTEHLIEHELRDPAYGEYAFRSMSQVPASLRYRIIQKHIDDYNDRASAIFFAIGLSLYEHVRHLPVPGRYYETLHSVADMVAALSRRRDQSYYSYLQALLYPKAGSSLDTIEYRRLAEQLKQEMNNSEELLDSYLRHVHMFYNTELGQYCSKEEVRRNAFREILAKILDRLNNTRDMDREHGFTVPARLYGTGFKNIFFVQAVEDKLRRPGFNTEERRLIENKFINKPKVAALYQILADLSALRCHEETRNLINFLEGEINRYLGTRSFRRLTPPRRGGYFNGLIYLFNDITLGRKSNLIELEKRPDKIAEVLVAFRAVLEAFLVYPVLMKEHRCNPERVRFRPYRIQGMGPGLERYSAARSDQVASILTLKSFNREVV